MNIFKATIFKALFLSSFIFCLVALPVAKTFTSPCAGNSGDCHDCCTGAQIRVPTQQAGTEFTNPMCPDQIDAETLLTFVSGVLESGSILRLLQQELYKRTNPINVRSLLDLPSLRPYYLDYCGWQIVAQPFYNATDPVFLTKHSPFIDSYVKLDDAALTDEIDLIIEDINNSGLLANPIEIDIPQTLSLFQNIRIQERRAGLMFSFAKEYKDWNFSFRIPLYYLEHNFFLSDAEINRIKCAPFFADDGLWGAKGTSGSVDEFVYTNLVNDRVGFCDSRFMALYNLVGDYKNDIWLGAIATLPTAVDIQYGVFGGRFSACEPIPPFDILSIVNSKLCDRNDKVTAMAEAIGIAALRKLSVILVDIPLGNGGHFGFGPHAEVRHFFNDIFSSRTMIEAEFFTSKRKKRFFLEDKSRFNFNIDLDDADQATQNLGFINEQVLNTFFPVCMNVTVHPGWLFKARQEFMLDFNCWQLMGGFDFWYQRKEHLGVGNLCGSKISLNTLGKSARPSAYQGKIFGSFGYYRHGNDFDWTLALAYDDTVFNKGIGKDYTVSLMFTAYL